MHSTLDQTNKTSLKKAFIFFFTFEKYVMKSVRQKKNKQGDIN